MKKYLFSALALAVLLAPSAFAVTGSVAVTSAGTDPSCNGISTITVTLNTAAPPPGSAPLDLVIAIDDSGSLSTTDFNREKAAAVAFVNGLDFTGSVRKVGVIKFATFAQTVIGLSNSKTAVINAINGIPHSGGNTNITDAIRDSRVMVTGVGSQPGADKVLLLITDGVNNQETGLLAGEVAAFKALPGEIFALGFGAADLGQLASIASDPDSTHVKLTPDAAQLSALAAEIADTIQNPAATNVQLNAVAALPFSPVSGSVSATIGTTSVIPGGFRWSIPTLGTETRTLTFQVRHSGNDNGAFAALSSLTGIYVDSDGFSRPVTASSPMITVSGCNDAPTAHAGSDQTVSLSGAPTVTVSLDGRLSSDPDPQDTLSYSWTEAGASIATGANPNVSLGLGLHLITLTVSDGFLSDSDEVLITVSDPTPPSITPNVTGTMGNNGWYRSNVGISWTVVDLESPTTPTGCGPSSITADTAGQSFTCSATSAGGTSSETVSAKRDATNPLVAYAGSRPSFEITETINITCNASDALSGLASNTCAGVSGPATSFLGSNTRSATAVDNAGNTATASITFTVTATPSSLCTLTERFIGHPGVAHSLCVKLEKGNYPSFINEVNAQRGKRLTNEQADLLILLVGTL